MAQSASQAITGNNSFNEGISINSLDELLKVSTGPNLVSVETDQSISDMSGKNHTIPRGGYLIFSVGELVRSIIMFSLISTGNFKLFGSNGFWLIESW